jgi:cytidine deaminase
MWSSLSQAAWACRENAFIFGKTKVGAALLTAGNWPMIVSGCNVEHKYRSHDVHAEVNAIANMVAKGGAAEHFRAIIVVAERERFTPCGACMDWIFQFGGPECLVAFQTSRAGPINVVTAHELMPFYPR